MVTYNNELANSEFLDGIEEYLQLKLGHHDNFVTSPRPAMGDNDETKYVAKREETHHRLGCDTSFLSSDGVKGGLLEHIGDDVAMRDHNRLLVLTVRGPIRQMVMGNRSVGGSPDVPLE